jgi:hypothetical protein
MGGRLYAGGLFSNAGGDPLADGAASYLVERPDARIGTSPTGPFLGNNVYNAKAGTKQHKTVSLAPGASHATFYLDIQNDGKLPDVFRLKGTGGATGFTARYYNAGQEVTHAVIVGDFTTPSLAPGASFLLRMVVTLAAPTAATATYLITASSQPGARVDAVKATVNAP